MLCNNCGAEIEDGAPFCPECGEETVIMREPLAHENAVPFAAPHVAPQEVIIEQRGLPGWAWLLFSVSLALCLLLGFFTAGLVGVYNGLQERADLNRQTAVEHYNRGLAHLEVGERELAIAEFEQALRLYPGYPEAQQKLREARAQIQTEPTPTSETVHNAASTLYDQAKSLYDQAKWEEAAGKLAQLRSLDPLYNPQEVETMLFSCYYSLGMELVDEDRMEEALRNFDKALEVRPSDPDALKQRKQASLYLAGLSYWKADWDKAVEVFAELYQMQPNYKDVKQRLYEAHLNYGDYLAEQGAWCSANREYAGAMNIDPNQTITSKQAEAERICQTTTAVPAVPTPTAQMGTAQATTPPTEIPQEAPTEATTPAETEVMTPTVSAPASGRIAFATYGDDRIYRLYTVEANGGEPFLISEAASQPSFSPDGTEIAFHSWRSDEEGIRRIKVDGSEEVEVSGFAEDINPHWSSDGKKIVFASNRAGDRRWRVYLVWLGAEDEAVELSLGRAPAWSPDGRIAYWGCNPQGGNCGIYVMGGGGEGTTRLTDNETDTIPAWSPDGQWIAFTSARNDNWDVYLVSSAGGEVKRLTDSPFNEGLPTWSPDGNHIAFMSDRDGVWGVYVMNADGRDQKRIAALEGTYQDWQSERISWTR
jgi:TolB protein